MATQNRGARITKLVGQIKKQYKPVAAPQPRTLLEHLLFACLLENSLHEAAEAAFEKLQTQYFDWNEVRVSTKRELAETMVGLVDPEQAAERLKRVLHSVFESVYAYDIEHLRKQNLGQAVKQLEQYEGTSPFTVAYVTQHSLGGHAIPVNDGLLTAFLTFDLITPAEAAKQQIPGLERAIPKAKGLELATVLHQLGVEVGKTPWGQNARKVMLAIDPSCKERLPKKPTPAPKAAPPQKKSAKATTKSPPAATKTPSKKAKTAAPAKLAAAPKEAPPQEAPQKKVGKKKVVKKKVAKKTASKKATASKSTTSKAKAAPKKKKVQKKTASRKISKRKPR